MKVVNRLVLAVSFMFASIAHANVILSMSPTTQVAQPGSTVSVTVMIDGLGSNGPLSLGSFNLLVEFDSSVLTFTGYNLFDDLGVVDPSDPLADAVDFSFGQAGSNLVHIAETSYLNYDDLNAIQPASFALTELFFTVNSSASKQTTDLSIVYWELVNNAGVPDEIELNELYNASIDVPAPATATLMGLGLLTMFVRKKRYSVAFKQS